MEQAPASQASPPAPTWSITKAEWDGYQRVSPGNALARRVLIGALLVFALAAMVVPTVMLRSSGVVLPIGQFMVVGGFFLGGVVVIMTFTRWWARRWDRLRPLVWEANGCVCPWCLERTDTTPCARHGFSRAQHRLMLDYWESLPALAFGDRARALIALRDAAPGGSLLWRLVGVVQRVRLRAEIVAHDPDSTPMQRVRAAIPRGIVTAVLVVILSGIVLAIMPRMTVSGIVPALLPWLVTSPFMVAIGPLWRRGRSRCSACNHICATERPTVCTECGADLTHPAAITRIERSSRAPLLLMLVPIGILMGVMFFQDTIVRALPAPVRNAYWTNIRPPTSYWENLTPPTMTQAEVDEAADLLIDCARPNRARPLFHFDFLCNAERAGKLTPAILEDVARATVVATLEVEQDGDEVVATVQPAFGELILGAMKTPRLVFGGVSLDDGPWTKGADWSLFMHDLDSFWRTAGQLRALPESQLVFTGRIKDAPKGTHTVRARCWIVIHGAQWERYTPTFDENGLLIPPAGAQVYPLDLKTTIEIK